MLKVSKSNPRYFEKMSVLLDQLIRERKQSAIEYARYLQRIVELVKNVKNVSISSSYPKTINTNAKRALYDNLDSEEALALKVNKYVNENKSDSWRGNRIKEKEVRIAIKQALEESNITEDSKVDTIFELVKNQNEY